MMEVPEAWRLPRMPVVPAARSTSATISGGNAGMRSGKTCQSHGTGSPASSQWPDGVSLPGLISIAVPQSPVGLASRPGTAAPEASRTAAPRPRASSVGRRSGPSTRSAAHHSARWARVFAPSSPNAAASGAPPQPTESSTTRNARLTAAPPAPRAAESRRRGSASSPPPRRGPRPRPHRHRPRGRVRGARLPSANFPTPRYG